MLRIDNVQLGSTNIGTTLASVQSGLTQLQSLNVSSRLTSAETASQSLLTSLQALELGLSTNISILQSITSSHTSLLQSLQDLTIDSRLTSLEEGLSSLPSLSLQLSSIESTLVNHATSLSTLTMLYGMVEEVSALLTTKTKQIGYGALIDFESANPEVAAGQIWFQSIEYSTYIVRNYTNFNASIRFSTPDLPLGGRFSVTDGLGNAAVHNINITLDGNILNGASTVFSAVRENFKTVTFIKVSATPTYVILREYNGL